MIKVALVGNGNQGRKLLGYFKNSIHGKSLDFTYIDRRTSSSKNLSIEQIGKGIDCFIISVPNDSLTNELLFFHQLGKPIFIEKPLINCQKDLEMIKKVPEHFKSKILVNYPFYYSKLSKRIIDIISSGKLGSIVRIETINGHGHAWTTSYRDSWRSKLELGVISMSTVHYLNYWISLFGIPTKISIDKFNHTKNGIAPDSGLVVSILPNDISLSIFSSYSIPNIFAIRIIGTDGILNCENGKIYVSSPRELLDITGRHISPKAILIDKFTFDTNWSSGQQEIVDNFCLSLISNNFNFSNFDNAIGTYKLILSNIK